MSDFHRRGNYAPVDDEVDLVDLEVVGDLPADLNGRYLRNGPNPVTGGSKFWFSGEGMLHEVTLQAGRATRYRNRWVRTPWQQGESLPKFDDSGRADLTLSLANTHVVEIGGRLLALEENSLPYEIDDDLGTVGPFDFDGRLTTSFTAHPKHCPITGEVHGFGYSAQSPYLVYHAFDAEGRLITSEPIDVPGPTMIHDIGLTTDEVILLDLPVVQHRLTRRQPSFTWSDTYGARLGVLPRHGSNADVRWFEIEPCYIFHIANCWRSTGHGGRRIVMDAARFPELWRAGAEVFAPPSVLWRYEIDLDAGTVKERQLDDRTVEFPRIDDRRAGSPARYGYLASYLDREDAAIVRFDLGEGSDSGTGVEHRFALGQVPGEPVVVPRGDAGSDSDETDAWILTVVYDRASDQSELHIIDAADPTAPAVAQVKLGRRVPFGFHGNWFADA